MEVEIHEDDFKLVRDCGTATMTSLQMKILLHFIFQDVHQSTIMSHSHWQLDKQASSLRSTLTSIIMRKPTPTFDDRQEFNTQDTPKISSTFFSALQNNPRGMLIPKRYNFNLYHITKEKLLTQIHEYSYVSPKEAKWSQLYFIPQRYVELRVIMSNPLIAPCGNAGVEWF